MKTASEWLREYGESHQNPTNKLIHWICVPAIFWSVALMLWSVPVPEALQFWPWINWTTVCLALVMVFYVMTSWALSIGMLLFSLLVVALTYWVDVSLSFPAWQVGLAIFVIAWILQFVGHKIEGKKPSFFKDILFLLVGPAWVIAFIYRKMEIKFA
jgi:uncharacterized membrane protein YGL010W